MKICVVGSGVIGLCTAHFLSRAGADVIVVDREPGPALGCSFANGGLIHPSYVMPWNEPGIAGMILRAMVSNDSALVLRPARLGSYLGWGVRFLANSRRSRYVDAWMRNLALAVRSLRSMDRVLAETGIRTRESGQGSLKIFRQRRALDAAAANAALLERHGLPHRVLTPDETVRLEPHLAPIAGGLAGAVLSEGDRVQDAREFCVLLADHLVAQGSTILYDTEVSAFACQGGSVRAALTSHGEVAADAFVIAAGYRSADLLASLGAALPVRPVKGYSLTYDRDARVEWPGHPVIDADLHAAVTPLPGALRVAGTAEFSGRDAAVAQARISTLRHLLEDIFPEVARNLPAAGGRSWAGMRPMSADGVPIVSQVGDRNVFVNTGHGQIGWTTAAASGELCAGLVLGLEQHVQPRHYSLQRFARGRGATAGDL